MKIGYFVSAFPYKNICKEKNLNVIQKDGGVENVAFNLAVQMSERGHDVFIFTTSACSKDSVEYYGHIKIYRFAKNFKVGMANISLSSLYKPLFLDLKLDVIHVHIGNLPLPISGYLYAKKENVPLITTYHEDYIGGFGSLARRFGVFLFDSFIIDVLLNGSDVVLTPSEHYVNRSKHLPKIKPKLIAVHNGIDLNNFDTNISKRESRVRLNLPPDKKIILFVGSLTPRKAPHILLKSMQGVIGEFQDSYLVFVGDGSMKKDLEYLAIELGIIDHVKFTGFIDEDIKLLYYSSSDIFVLPSFSEGFGIVLLEASAYGLPLVVSNLEVFNSIVKEGYNGLFTRTGDEKDLGEKILFLLKNDDFRIKMGLSGKDKVADFSWEYVAGITEEIYYNFLKACS